MANAGIVQMALLLCFSTTALSMKYDVLRFQHRGSMSASWTLIGQLNGTSHYCLQDWRDFKFPEEIKLQKFQKEEAISVIDEMLNKTIQLFGRNFSSTGWNVTIIEKLSDELSRQMDLVKSARKEIMKEEKFTLKERTTQKHLKEYYSRIVDYLEDELYSRCAWIVVRGNLLKTFSVLNELTDFVFEN